MWLKAALLLVLGVLAGPAWAGQTLLPTCNNGVIVTGPTGIPSCSTVLPTGVTTPTVASPSTLQTGPSSLGSLAGKFYDPVAIGVYDLYGWGCSAVALGVYATTGNTSFGLGNLYCPVDGDNVFPWGPAAHPSAGEDRAATLFMIQGAPNTFGGALGGTFTSTTFLPTVALTTAQVANLRVGMEVKTDDATPYWGLLSGWAANGTSITVQEWCLQNSGVEACTTGTPSGAHATISPKNGIWAANFITDRTSTSEERQSLGNEYDVENNTGTDDTGTDSTSWPFDIGMTVQSIGTNRATAGIQISGTFNVGLNILSGTMRGIFTNGGIDNNCNGQLLYPTAETNGSEWCNNFSNGSHEADLWNTQTTGDGFRFLQQTGASAKTDLLFLHSNANANFPGWATFGSTSAVANGTVANVGGGNSYFENISNATNEDAAYISKDGTNQVLSGLLAATGCTAGSWSVYAGNCELQIASGKVQVGATTPAHVISAQTTAPALSSCGTGSPSIVGSDTAGTVTMGTAATACTITFNVAYTSAPHCTVTWRATPLATQTYTVSNAAITLGQTSTSGDIVDYICVAPSGG